MIDMSMSIAIENELIALQNELDALDIESTRLLQQTEAVNIRIGAVTNRLAEIGAVINGLIRDQIE